MKVEQQYIRCLKGFISVTLQRFSSKSAKKNRHIKTVHKIAKFMNHPV